MYARVAIFLLGALTGLRRRHLLVFAAAAAAAVAAVTVLFLWLGELADGAVGVPGVLAVVIAWAAAVALVLGGSALAAARMVLRRIARALRAGAASSGARSPRTSRS